MSRHSPPATIIVLNYNTRELLLDCLNGFAREVVEEDWQVVVVDNGSSDGSAGAVQAAFPSVELVRSDRNVGFAAGNNLGLQQARGAALMLLNTDVIVTGTQLNELVTYLEIHPDVGAVSAGLRTRDGEPQAFAYGDDPSLGYILRRGARRLLGRKPLHDWHVAEPIDTDWVSGACLAVRASVYRRIGGLDEQFFLYFEDVDWCRRIRHAGWRIVYNPEVQVIHLGGRSQPERAVANRLYETSLLKFYAKHYGVLARAALKALLPVYRLLISR